MVGPCVTPALTRAGVCGVCWGLGGRNSPPQTSRCHLGCGDSLAIPNPSSFGALLCTPFPRGSHNTVPTSSPWPLCKPPSCPPLVPGLGHSPHCTLQSQGSPSLSQGHPSVAPRSPFIQLPAQTSTAGTGSFTKHSLNIYLCRIVLDSGDLQGRETGSSPSEPASPPKTEPASIKRAEPPRRAVPGVPAGRGPQPGLLPGEGSPDVSAPG